MDKQFYIGIDGGGTKTKYSLFDQEGNVLKEYIGKTVHVLQVEQKECINRLKEGISILLEGKELFPSIGVGLAGYGENQELRYKIEYICKEAFSLYTYSIYNDIQIACYGALGGEDGIVVIAGTGSIAMSCQNGVMKRSGGWGANIGDEGSAYWMAKKLLGLFSKQADGRLEKTPLYDLVMDYCKIENPYDIIPYINTTLCNDRTKIAELSVLVYEAAKKDDQHAICLYQEAADELVQIISSLIKEFKEKVTISYVGGVFQAKEYILNPINELLENSNCKIVLPKYTPEYGAYLLLKNKEDSNY